MVISVPQCAHTRTYTHAHFYMAKTHLFPHITFTDFPETSQTLLVLGGKHGGTGLYHTYDSVSWKWGRRYLRKAMFASTWESTKPGQSRVAVKHRHV